MPATTCRVIVDTTPQPGAVNMAIDAALLQAADEQPAVPVVRIYRWSEPTLSLGYFQKYDASLADDTLTGCPQVSRLTGGGAILHHHELTYSCVIPRTHPIRSEPLRLYDIMHHTILRVLKSCGANAGFRADFPSLETGPESSAGSSAEPFLCFLRSDPRDLAASGAEIVGHPKIAGSAQRRRRGTILQHGSILLKSSVLLPDVAGISNLFPEFDLSTFVSTLPSRMGTSICDAQIASKYTDRERYFVFNSGAGQSRRQHRG